MQEEFELIAKTFQGLEGVLAQELTELGANDVEMGKRMVSFKGDKEMMYKANFCLRTAIRILKPIKKFKANNADDVYNEIKAIEWSQYMDVTDSIAVDAVVYSEAFRHSMFVAYRVKDAIVDYFKEKTGARPSVKLSNPDFTINIHIAEDNCTLSLDSSGESLHKRGYRQEQVEAPLNEVLAAGMILMTGWRGECDLIDPMCGSGTIPIEAALIAKNIAPGVFRKGFGFEKWKDFDSELFDRIYNDDSGERSFEHKIYGYDNSLKANETARRNVKAAGVSKDVVLKVQPFQQFEKPAQKSIIITNPPYGERISTDDLLGLYEMIGERLKHAFAGNEAWIISYRDECFDQIGLKASEKIPLYNGALECQFRKYQIFDGKYREFRQEGQSVKGGPSQEERPARRRASEKVEYGRRDRQFSRERRDPDTYRRERTEGDTYRRERAEGDYYRRERRPEGDPYRENRDATPYRRERTDGEGGYRRERRDGEQGQYGERRGGGYSRDFREDRAERRNYGERDGGGYGERRPYQRSQEGEQRERRPSTDDGRPRQSLKYVYMHPKHENNEEEE